MLDTLQSLLKIDYPKDAWEIIVVDQTKEHQPETQSLLEVLERRGQISWYRPPEIDFASLTKARNFGLRKAKDADILLFVDDDVSVEPDFIRQHLTAYLNKDSGKVGATVGKVRVVGQEYPPCGKRIGGITWWGNFLTNYHGDKPGIAENFIGCNFSLRANLIETLGYFDEEFVGNAMREESDMAMRVREIGWQIRFVPEAFVWHKQTVTGGTRSEARIKWYYSYFFNNFLFYAKHASAWRLPFFILHMWRPILACWLYYGRGRLRAAWQPWRGIYDGVKAAKRSLKKGAAVPRQKNLSRVF